MKMPDDLSLKESAVVYLDRSGGLRKLAEDCEQFKDTQHHEAVYSFSIGVNPSDVIELDPALGDCVLHDPVRATALFQSVCFLAIKTLSLVEKLHTQSQVNVILRLTHLPPFPEYTLDLCSFPRGRGPTRPVSIEGLVIGITTVMKRTQGPGVPCVTDDFPSPTDKQLVELIHINALDALKGNQQSSLRYQSVTLILRDELCNSMRIGRLYKVLGIPAHVHQWPNITWSLETNNVQSWEPEYPNKVSVSFQELLKATTSSPWSFPAIVAHCFGLDMAPPGLHDTLKLGLLLSLVQTRADAKDTFHNLDLLIVTTDTLILDRLMANSLGLARCGVRHKASEEMFVSVSQDEHGTGMANISAGSALLATGGICMLGDLGCYKKERLDSIISVLESRAVSVSILGKKNDDIPLNFPVQCNFWALTDSTQWSGGADWTVLRTVEMGPIPIELADAFGLVIRCRDMVGEQALLAQTVHTLQQAVQPGKPLYSFCWEFSPQDYQELVAHAQSLQVELSPGAEKMINGYHIASHRVRSQSHGVKMSVASHKLLTALAEAHCRLCLRTHVLEEDAVIAVLLCENSLSLKHGATALGIPSDAVFPCDMGDVDGLQRRDMILRELQQNILRFIYTYTSGADTFTTEE